MPAKKTIGERKLKALAREIVEHYKDNSAFQVIFDMDDPQYCRMRAIEELQTNFSLDAREWAVMLLLYSIAMEQHGPDA